MQGVEKKDEATENESQRPRSKTKKRASSRSSNDTVSRTIEDMISRINIHAPVCTIFTLKNM